MAREIGNRTRRRGAKHWAMLLVAERGATMPYTYSATYVGIIRTAFTHPIVPHSQDNLESEQRPNM